MLCYLFCDTGRPGVSPGLFHTAANQWRPIWSRLPGGLQAEVKLNFSLRDEQRHKKMLQLMFQWYIWPVWLYAVLWPAETKLLIGWSVSEIGCISDWPEGGQIDSGFEGHRCSQAVVPPWPLRYNPPGPPGPSFDSPDLTSPASLEPQSLRHSQAPATLGCLSWGAALSASNVYNGRVTMSICPSENQRTTHTAAARWCSG